MRDLSQVLLSIMISGLLFVSGCTDSGKPSTSAGNVAGSSADGDPGANDATGEEHNHTDGDHSESEAAADTGEEPAPPVSETAPWPKAVVESKLYEFGTMGIDQEMSHVFKIRNDGDSPLELRRGKSTCKCTIGKLGSRSIAPGESGNVIMTWHPRTVMSPFRQTATIKTNDPKHRLIDFEIKGTVERHIALLPSHVWYIGRLGLGQTHTIQGSIDSKTMSSFKIIKIESEDPAITVTSKPYSAADLEEHNVASGHWVTAVVNPGLPSGQFSKKVTITTNGQIPQDKTFQEMIDANQVNPSPPEEVNEAEKVDETNDVVVTASESGVLRAPLPGQELTSSADVDITAMSDEELKSNQPGMVVSFQVEGIQDGPYEFLPGPGLRRSPALTIVNLGTFSASEGKHLEMTLLVLGLGEDELNLVGTHQTQDFFDVSMEPIIDFGEDKDRKKYRIVLDVPPGRPAGIYSGLTAKNIVLKTNYPNELNREIRLKIEFTSKEGQ